MGRSVARSRGAGAKDIKVGYRYYRNALIQSGLLSIGACAIFYDALTGKNVGEPAALFLISALVIFGNGWLAYVMLKAKKQEQAGQPTGQSSPAVVSAASRQRQRKGMLVFTFFASLFLIVMGMRGWSVNLIPTHYLGLFLLGFCGLGAAGVNIWKGGPLDPRHDPPSGT